MENEIHRKITSATYTPSVERQDDADWAIGDVTYVRLDCGHTVLGNPTMHYKAGTTMPCRQCVGEAGSLRRTEEAT